MSPASLLPILALILALAVPASATEVADLPRPAGGLLDRTGRVTHESTAEFRRIAEHVRRETGGEIAAVVIDSLKGKETSAFARELSESWRLGGDDARGVLILVALQDRQVELALGRGLDDPERRERAAQIVHDTLAPRLHAGDLGGALVAAARESATRIFYAVEVVEPKAGEEEPADRSPESSPAPPGTTLVPAGRSFGWVPYAIGLAVLLLGLAVYGALRSEKC
ncbi:MAG TPA: TPM domain-containing protein [Thermoanaerobaculia bacterium]|nr:TPM domain-containing protein [Thermoanaerobaculia bacterium]